MTTCKYCHLQGHSIDKCPTIVCRVCKAVGHPGWLCTTSSGSKPRSRRGSGGRGRVSTPSVIRPPLSGDVRLEEPPRESKTIYGFESTGSMGAIAAGTSRFQDFKGDFRGRGSVMNRAPAEAPAPVINMNYYTRMEELKWGDIVSIK